MLVHNAGTRIAIKTDNIVKRNSIAPVIDINFAIFFALSLFIFLILKKRYVFFSIKFLSKKNIPVVFTVHDMWNFTGGCYYYTNVNCDGFKSGCKKCPKKTKEIDCSNRKTSKYFKKKMN